MDALFRTIEKNPFRDSCPPAFTKETPRLQPKESLWGAAVRKLTPARLQTAWLMLEDPMMLIAGDGYRANEVRDRTFELQEEAIKNLRGNRKLTKARMGDALAAIKPTEEQMMTTAAILLAMKQIQTVCFDTVNKKVWTMPEDLTAWTRGGKTLWVDAKGEVMLDWSTPPSLGAWLADREEEGWMIPWPESKESLVDMKKMAEERGITVKAKEFGAKVKKEDYARTIGRALAVEHLGV
jgi:hypothetical protein